MGVKAIKKMGGTVIVQDEKTSQFFGMPGAAMQTGCVDFVMPLQEIPSALITPDLYRGCVMRNVSPATKSWKRRTRNPIEQ
jgi:CheB methylesterase